MPKIRKPWVSWEELELLVGGNWAPAAHTHSGSEVVGFTGGSIPFVHGSGFLTQDNANFFWDAANIRLGIGTGAPDVALDIEFPAVASVVSRVSAKTRPWRHWECIDGNWGLAIGIDANDKIIHFNYDTPIGTQDTCMMVFDGGNTRVGILDATPSYPLDVGGNTNIQGTFRVTGATTLLDTLGVSGLLSNTGGAKLEIQGAVDGTSARGIFMWDTTSTSWGIYMSQSGAGKSLANGVACTDFAGATGHHFRFRISDTADRSFVWENSSEACLMDLEGSTGNLTILGNFALRSNKELRFYDNGNYVGFEAPALTGDQIWVLPAADGPANEVLGTDNAGNLIWRTHDELAGFEAGEHFTMLDEDNMVSDSDTQAATQQSIKAYVDAQAHVDEKVKVDVGAVAGYLGAAFNDGVLRTGASLSYADGGNFITINTIQNIQTGASPTFAGVTLGNEGLHILDTNDSHDLIIKVGSDLTADRILSFVTGDSARTITLSGNPTLADWFDQAVKAASTPTFDDLTISTPVNIYALSHNSFADYAANQHRVWEDSIAQDIHADNIASGAVTQHEGDIDHDALTNTHANPYKLDDLAAPDDNTDLDFSTALHGLVPKGTDAGNYLKDDGTWAMPAGGGDVTAAANMTDHTLLRGDGGAKGIQDTGIVVDDSDNVNFQAGNLVTTGTISAATAKLSGLTDGYVPYHVDDATGLANSPIFTDGTKVGILIATPDGTLHVHTATAGSVTAHAAGDDLVVENSTHGGVSVLVPDAANATYILGTPSANRGARLEWGYAASAAYLITSKIGATIGLYADNEILNLTLSGASGSEVASFVGKVGIGTATIPHGGVGWAKFAIDGADASSAGPHVQFTTATDDYPLLQISPYNHDNVVLYFDCYYDGGASAKSSSVNSNFAIYKSATTLDFLYDSGIAQGAVTTWNTGISLTRDGYVGIGTIPAFGKKLEVKAAENAQLAIIGHIAGHHASLDFHPNIAGTPAQRGRIMVSYGADTDAGIMNFYLNDTAGNEQTRMVIAQNGYIGLPTANPLAKVHIYGVGHEAVRIGDTEGTLGLSFGYDDDGNTIAFIQNRHAHANAAFKFGFGAVMGAGTAMTILGNGDVGIGISAVEEKLHVSGGDIKIGMAASASGAIKFGVNAGTDYHIITYDDSTGYLTFSSDTGTRNLIFNQGNIGVNVTPEAWDPQFRVLQLGGAAAFVSSAGFGDGGQSYLTHNAYYDDTNNRWEYIGADEATMYMCGNEGTHAFKVATSGVADGAITWITAMTILNSGNVGIGTATPQVQLAITTGDINLEQWSDGTNSIMSSFDRSGSPGYAPMLFYGSAYTFNVGDVTMAANLILSSATSTITGGAKLDIEAGATGVHSNTIADDTTGVTANMYIASISGKMFRSTSAKKYKDKIKDLELDSSLIHNLRPVSFNSLCEGDDKDRRFIGLVAEDIESVLPEIVHRGKDNKIENYDSKMLVTLMLKEIQRMNERINALESAQLNN